MAFFSGGGIYGIYLLIGSFLVKYILMRDNILSDFQCDDKILVVYVT